MTHKIDKLLAQAGFDLEELQSISHRRFLYGGIVAATLFSLIFYTLTFRAILLSIIAG